MPVIIEIEVLKLILEEVILISKNGPKIKKRIMSLEVKQETVNKEIT
ncbi:6402_t:CDS:2 [Cetraspora pellucida]|uniref:6402_t:CDS:1 n=1 Tax=Cetraspora pellucida TaxID=1433469 RepID=A0A9N9HKJ5_9GLOM|nr:6402_t:CDS:2 [Cetraspora pellucida]